MIGPGCLPRACGFGAGGLKKRTLAYTRTPRRKQRVRNNQALAGALGHDGNSTETIMTLFDHGPPEFPIATARAMQPRARLVAMLADLERWLDARWLWLKPRAVPCAVAGLGMMAVLASADYLAHPNGHATTQASAVYIQVAPR